MKCSFALATLMIICSVAIGVSSCKAWRTVTTTASYTQKNDSAQTTTTIQTKTVEEYQGVKKK